jgi:hypothetical protein
MPSLYRLFREKEQAVLAFIPAIPGLCRSCSCCELSFKKAAELFLPNFYLKLCGAAKIFFGICNPPAFFTNEFCILNPTFIIVEAVFQVSHIDQIAQMFIMHGVWHLRLIHIYPLFCFIHIEQGLITCPFINIDTISIRALQ